MDTSDKPLQKTLRIGNSTVGLIGLDLALSRALELKLNEKDAVALLFDLVEKENYIPPGMEESYREALLNEYQRLTSEQEQSHTGLTIRILGPACVSCSNLGKMVIETLQKFNIAADVENIHELDEIWRQGVIITPTLIINGQVKCAGKLPPMTDIETWIREALA